MWALTCLGCWLEQAFEEVDMQYLKNLRQAISTFLLAAGVLSVLLWPRPFPSTRAADYLQFDVPTLVHGLAKAPGLPEGDVFLLPKPVRLTINRPPESTALFAVSDETF